MGVKNPNRQKVRRAHRPAEYPRGQWHPELIGIIPNYPKTLADWEVRRAAGRKAFQNYFEKHGHYPGRKGVPDGWGKRAAENKAIREAAAAEAKEIVKVMKDKGIIPDGTDPRAEEALEFAIGVVRAKDEKTGQPAYAVKDHLAAARTVLEWTKAKPASTANVNVNAAEAFLESLAGEVTPKE